MSEAAVGSDSRALQAGGRRFDPGHAHQSPLGFRDLEGPLSEPWYSLLRNCRQEGLPRPLLVIAKARKCLKIRRPDRAVIKIRSRSPV